MSQKFEKKLYSQNLNSKMKNTMKNETTNFYKIKKNIQNKK